jgi:oligosaccharide repeat unit polymerase
MTREMAVWGSTLIRVMLAAVFFLYILPIAAFSLDYPFQVFQVLLLFSFFLLGALVAMRGLGRIPYIDYSNRFMVTPKAVYWVFAFYLVTNYSVIGNSIYALINNSFISFTYQNAVDRYENYEEVSNLTFFERVSVIGFLMSGSLSASVTHNKGRVHMMLFIMIIVESMQLARYGVLFVFVTYFIEYAIRNNRGLQLMPVRKIFKLGLYVIFSLSLIFLFSAYFRVAGRVDDVMATLLYKLGQYTIAMHEALLIWMSNYSDSYASTLGTNSLAGIYKIFGYKVDQGFYKLTDTSFGPTNIYSIFRGLLSDFGVIGTSVILLISGYTLAKYSKISMSFISFNLVRLIMLVTLFCLISPLNYFNCVVAVMMSGIIISGFNFGISRSILDREVGRL